MMKTITRYIQFSFVMYLAFAASLSNGQTAAPVQGTVLSVLAGTDPITVTGAQTNGGTVSVTDSGGQPLAGVRLTRTLLDNTGVAQGNSTPPSILTNASGVFAQGILSGYPANVQTNGGANRYCLADVAVAEAAAACVDISVIGSNGTSFAGQKTYTVLNNPAIAINSGDLQLGTAGRPLAQPLVVQVSGANAGIPNTPVRWLTYDGVTGTGGLTVVTTTNTDANGFASLVFTPPNNNAGRRVLVEFIGRQNGPIFVVNAAAEYLPQVISGNNQRNAFPNTQPQALVVRLIDPAGKPLSNISVSYYSGIGSIPNTTPTTVPGDTINGVVTAHGQLYNITSDTNGLVTFAYKTSTAADRFLRVCSNFPPLQAPPPDNGCVTLLIAAKGALTLQEQDSIKTVVTSLGIMSITSIRTQFNNIQRRFQYIRGGGGSGFSTDINVNANLDGQQIPVPGGQTSQGAESSDETTAGIKQGKWGAYIMGGVDVLKVKGESGYKIGTNGITAGADYRVSRKLLVGGALGFMRGSTEIANGAGDQTATGTSFTLYSSFEPTPAWFVDVGLSSGRNSFDIKRTQSDGGIAKSSTSGGSTGLTLTGGYSLRSKGWMLSPYGRVDTLKVNIEGFTEEGTNALIVGSQNLRSTALSAGGIAQYSISTGYGIVVPQARLEFQRQTQNSGQGVTARLVGSDVQVLVAPDLEIDKTSGTLGVGLSTQFRHGLSAFADYEQLFGKSNTSQYRLSAGVKLEF
jgi:outer membrane lipase/esterase